MSKLHSIGPNTLFSDDLGELNVTRKDFDTVLEKYYETWPSMREVVNRVSQSKFHESDLLELLQEKQK